MYHVLSADWIVLFKNISTFVAVYIQRRDIVQDTGKEPSMAAPNTMWDAVNHVLRIYFIISIRINVFA